MAIASAGSVTIVQGPMRAAVRSAYLEQVKRIAPPQLFGRETELAELAAFCLEGGRGPYLWWRASPWAGKSALLSTFVLHPPELLTGRVWIVSFFITARLAAQDTREAFTTVLLEQLSALTGHALPAIVDEATREACLLDLLAQAAVTCQHAGGRLLLVVDGLDEDRGVTVGPDAHSIAGLLPADPPAEMRIIVAGRPNPPIPDDVPDWHPLRDPGIIRMLSDSPHARDLRRLGKAELKRLLKGTQLEQDLLCLLTAARGGLSGPDLRELTGADLAHIEDVLHTVAGRTFNRRASPWESDTDHEVYLLGHEELFNVALHYLGRARLAECRDRLYAWAHTYRLPGNGKQPWPATTPAYLLDTYPATLDASSPVLVALLNDPGWLDAAIRFAGVDRVLTELRRADAAGAEVSDAWSIVSGQAHHLRSAPDALPGHTPRQLGLQATELGSTAMAEAFRARARAAGAVVLPQWTTHSGGPAPVAELTVKPRQLVRTMVALPDGGIAYGDRDGGVLTWNPDEPIHEPVEIGRACGWVSAMSALPDGRVAAGYSNGLTRIYGTTGSSTEEQYGRDGMRPVQATAGLGTKFVASGHDNGEVNIWTRGSSVTSPRHQFRLDCPVTALATLPNGRLLIGDSAGRVLLWRAGRRTAGPRELSTHSAAVTAMAVLPGNDAVVVGGSDGRLLILSLDGAVLGEHDSGCGDSYHGVTTVAALPDGRIVYGSDRTAVLWDHRFNDARVLGTHDRLLWTSTVRPDGSVVTGGDEGRIQVWLPQRATPRRQMRADGRGATKALAFLPGGLIAAGNPSTALSIRDGRGTEIRRIDWALPTALALLPDGRIAIGLENKKIRIWDPATSRVSMPRVRRTGIDDMAVVADGRVAYLMTAGRGRLLRWDLANPDADPIEFAGSEAAISVAAMRFPHVVTGHGDGCVTLWNATRPNGPRRVLGRHGHIPLVWAVDALPDGRVVSVAADGNVLVWDPARPHAPQKLGAHRDGIVALAVLPWGDVVTGGLDRRVIVWDPLTSTKVDELSCSVRALAVKTTGPDTADLLIAHANGGHTLASVRPK